MIIANCAILGYDEIFGFRMPPSCSDTETTMEKEKKQNLRMEMKQKIAALSDADIREKSEQVAEQLLSLANFMESETALFYVRPDYPIDTRRIINHCLRLPKKIVLPSFDKDKKLTLWKINSLETDLLTDAFTPNPDRCKPVHFNEIDIAIIPGIAFDEKGGRTGSGRGHCDRIIPKLPNTSRKVALAYTEQLVSQVPMESHDKFVDIIITERRIIYKI